MRAKDALGRAGEDVAVRHLESCGLRILDRNWRCRDGELDIVARTGRVLVVCEVKTRSNERYGRPFEAVDRRKVARLRRLAVRWLAAHGLIFDEVRIDVVGLTVDGHGGFTVEHAQGVG